MDVLTPEQRHKNMSNIRGKDTKPELWLRKRLFELGYRYRKNVKNVPGHPDLWLKKYNTAIFIHGCFWHRHSHCKYASIPKTRIDFWTRKFERNIERDNQVKKELSAAGIRELIIWECTVKQMRKDPEFEKRILMNISDFLLTNSQYQEL